jgi:hypothetical protein
MNRTEFVERYAAFLLAVLPATYIKERPEILSPADFLDRYCQAAL